MLLKAALRFQVAGFQAPEKAPPKGELRLKETAHISSWSVKDPFLDEEKLGEMERLEVETVDLILLVVTNCGDDAELRAVPVI